MGKLTTEQQTALAELERLRDAAEDDDVEVYVRDERGRETRLTGAHAQRWLTQLFGEEAAAAGNGATAPLPAKKTPKKAPAGKAAPTAGDNAGEGEEGDEGEGEEGDPPPARRHWLFGSPPPPK